VALEPSAPLNASGAAEADRDRAIVSQNHRHRAAAFAQAEHPLELGRVLLDVDVLERDMPPIEVFTGGLRVGSGVFPEDDRHDTILRLKPEVSSLKTGTSHFLQTSALRLHTFK
jgi:hypothetical protein